MNKIIHLAPLLLCSFTLCGKAIAQQQPDTDGTTDRFFASARVGLWNDDLRGHDEVQTSPPTIVVYGASVAGRFLGGAADSVPVVRAANWSAGFSVGSGESDGVRSERESGELFLLAPPSRYFGLAVGYRYEHAEDEVQTSAGMPELAADTTMHSVRFGVAGALPLQNSEDIRLFTAAYVAGGSQKTRVSDPTGTMRNDDSTFFGPEVVVGYSQRITDSAVLEIRYRTTLYVTDFSSVDRAQTQNAVFVSIGRRF
jgi:opacity protein-like surface antigen